MPENVYGDKAVKFLFFQVSENLSSKKRLPHGFGMFIQMT